MQQINLTKVLNVQKFLSLILLNRQQRNSIFVSACFRRRNSSSLKVRHSSVVVTRSFSCSSVSLKSTTNLKKADDEKSTPAGFEPSTAAANDVITLTDGCVERLKKVAGDTQCLRVLVDSGGCSGFEYKFDLVDTKSIQSNDRVFEKNGAKIVVDDLSIDFLRGASIDFQQELIKAAFRVVNNPKAAKGCSCGASFALKS